MKPKVSSVTRWVYDEEMSNPIVEIYYADIDNAFFKAAPVVKGYKVKYFYGETAWMDSRRYAGDIYTQVMHMS